MASDSLDRMASRKLRSLERRALRRELAITDRGAAPRTRRGGRNLVSFSCNDYLGLSRHPDVVAAAVEAARRYGAGAGASRLVTGNHPLYEELEQRLAAFKGTESAVVFGSGYLANAGTLPVLAGPQDLILVDELSHSCIGAGAALSRATVLPFSHNDAPAADRLLANHRHRHRHCLVVTEGVFSMDGDVAPLADLADAAERHDAWLMTDDAHAVGVVGGGRGSAVAAGVPSRVPLQMGTLSKALGSYGGYVCASEAVAELLRNRARTLVYSTGLPPSAVAAAIAALDVVAANPDLVEGPLRRARLFTDALELPAASSAIVPIIVGSAERALAAGAALERHGFLVVPIRPPTVQPATSRLRLAFCADHTEQDVLRLAAAVADTLRLREPGAS